MASGRDFGWLYPRQDQVCFLAGHVRAFAHLDGVPHRLLYDNLRPAVARVLVGAARVLTARMQALVAHYAFEPSFARPGTGHDKGGVESRGRAIRWQDLVPIPAGPDLETISQRLLARLDGRLATQRRRGGPHARRAVRRRAGGAPAAARASLPRGRGPRRARLAAGARAAGRGDVLGARRVGGPGDHGTRGSRDGDARRAGRARGASARPL